MTAKLIRNFNYGVGKKTDTGRAFYARTDLVKKILEIAS